MRPRVMLTHDPWDGGARACLAAISTSARGGCRLAGAVRLCGCGTVSGARARAFRAVGSTRHAVGEFRGRRLAGRGDLRRHPARRRVGRLRALDRGRCPHRRGAHRPDSHCGAGRADANARADTNCGTGTRANARGRAETGTVPCARVSEPGTCAAPTTGASSHGRHRSRGKPGDIASGRRRTPGRRRAASQRAGNRHRSGRYVGSRVPGHAGRRIGLSNVRRSGTGVLDPGIGGRRSAVVWTSRDWRHSGATAGVGESQGCRRAVGRSCAPSCARTVTGPFRTRGISRGCGSGAEASVRICGRRSPSPSATGRTTTGYRTSLARPGLT